MKNIEICFSHVGVGIWTGLTDLLALNSQLFYKVTSPQDTLKAFFGGHTNFAADGSTKIRLADHFSLYWQQAAIPYAWP
jgi:hypothetical protein